jgi:hypothetical protein
MSTSPPPIREPWKTDKDGKLISLPWVLWLQQLANLGQMEELFSDPALLLSTTDISSLSGAPATPDDVASLAAMIYNPSSSSVPLNDPEALIWMSF